MKCERCGKEADRHGLYNIIGEHVCWWCMKKEELKDEESEDYYND